MAVSSLRVLRLHHYPIFEQLCLEEYLLRMCRDNWLIINEGSPDAIVMGISGKMGQLIDQQRLSAAPVPVIRRYSGGGTVYVDTQTLFVTFICNRHDVADSPAYPDQILHWTKRFYAPLSDQFTVLENDYTLAGRKFGGNAQYLTKDRWVHHTSLLWDFDPHKMNYLLLPPRRPHYRSDRSHADFLCRLCERFSSKNVVIEGILNAATTQFSLEKKELSDLPQRAEGSFRLSTTRIA